MARRLARTAVQGKSGGGLALYPVLLFAFGGVTPAEARAVLQRRRGDPPAPPADLL